MKTQHVYTAEDERLIREMFETHSHREIGARIGASARGVQQKCVALRLRHRADLGDLRAALLAAAVEGFYNADIEDWPLKTVRCQTDKLRNQGLLFPARHTTRAGQTAKYFDTAAKAEAFKQARKPKAESRAYTVPNMRPITIAKPRVHAWWPADAEPHFTAQTIRTYGASPGRVLRTNTFAE